MPLLFGFDGTVPDWVSAKLGIPKYELPHTAFGIVNTDGRLTGGLVFFGHKRDRIDISLAGRGALKWKLAGEAALHQHCAGVQGSGSAGGS